MHKHCRELAKEVDAAEKKLAQRQIQVQASTESLDQAVRQRITSPDVLLWSVAGGFALGELTRKHKPETVSHHAQASAEQARDEHGGEAHQPGKLQVLLRYVAIARPLIASVTELVTPWLQHLHAEAEARAAQQAAANQQAADPAAAPPTFH
jgi:hypothetical protein